MEGDSSPERERSPEHTSVGAEQDFDGKSQGNSPQSDAGNRHDSPSLSNRSNTPVDNRQRKRANNEQALEHSNKRKRTDMLKGYTIPKVQPQTTQIRGLSDYEEDHEAYDDLDTPQEVGQGYEQGWSSQGNELDEGFYNPLAEYAQCDLTPQQLQFLNVYVTGVKNEPELQERITQEVPTPPQLTEVLARQLDPEVIELFSKPSQFMLKETDSSLRAIAKKLWTLFGPMFNMWSMVLSDDVDLKELRTNIERCIIMLGQANGDVNYYRRRAVLSRFFNDAKKATEVIKENEDVFLEEEKKLFGGAFYRALAQNARNRKQLSDARNALVRPTPGARGRNPFSARGQPRGFYQTPRASATFTPTANRNQPFRGGPSLRGGWGGGRGRPGPKGQRYVPIDSKNNSFTSSGRFEVSKNKNGTHRGEHIESHSELEANNVRCMGTRDGSRLSHRTAERPIPKGITHLAKVFPKPDKVSDSGNPKITRKESNRESQTHTKPIPELCFPQGKERRVTKTNYKPQTFQQMGGIQPFQNGKLSNHLRHDTKRGILCKDRSQRCIPLGTNLGNTPKIPTISLGKSNIPVPGLSVRSGVSTTHVYETHETSGRNVEKNGNQNDNISRRHDHT